VVHSALDGPALERPRQVPDQPQARWVADGIHEVKDRRRRTYLLLEVTHVGTVEAGAHLAPCCVQQVVQGRIHTPSLEAGKIAPPAVENCGDRLVAIPTRERWPLANGIDLRLRRIACDERGQLRLLGKEEHRVRAWMLDLALVVDIEVCQRQG